MSCPSKPDRNGFTLMELLVAIAITGIIATMLFSMLSGTVSNWKKAEERMNRGFKDGNLYMLISAKLEGLVEYDSRTDPGLYFRAEPDRVRFISFETLLFPYRPVVSEFFVEGENLMLSETPYFWDRVGIGIPEPRERVLSGEVDALEVHYLLQDAAVKDDPGEWVDNWSSDRNVQQSRKLRDIRLTVRWADGREMVVSHPLKQEAKKNERPRF